MSIDSPEPLHLNYGNAQVDLVVKEAVAVARKAALEEAAVELAKSYPDNANTNAFCAAIRALKNG